jgi:diguanylate cyclase (GGDEF)-like protein
MFPGSSITSVSRAVIVAALAWLAWVVFAVWTCTGHDARSGLGGVMFVVALAGATLVCLVRAWESRLSRRLVLAGAVGFYGWSAAVYGFDGAAAAKAFPSVYDSGLIVFYGLAMVTVVQFIRTYMTGTPRAIWLDAVALAASASAVGAAVLLPSLGAHPSLGQIGQLLYVLGDLTLLAFVFAAWGLSGWRRVPTMASFSAGALALALADGAFVVTGAHTPPLLSVIVWPAAMLLVATATFWEPRPQPAVVSSWAKIGVPTTAAGAAIVVASVTHSDLAQGFAMTALTLVVFRLIENLRENSRLIATVSAAAVSDSLTGLANRQLLLDRLAAAMSGRSTPDELLAVLFLDLDDFKLVNDTLGHSIGDEVLGIVAQRLLGVLRGGRADTVARLGGDEFVVLIECLRDPADAARVAERILDALRAPIAVQGHDIVVDTSVGVTIVYGDDPRTPVEILRDADTAMYAAKDAGKGGLRVFADEMHTAMVERVQLTAEIRTALARNEFRLLFQPQIDLETGEVKGVEALVRWEHPRRGLLTPDKFIPVAEVTGVITALDDWVLGAACRQARLWRDAGHDVPVAINVSARRLAAGGLACEVDGALKGAGLPGASLEIEITESAAVEPDEATIDTLERLRSQGVHVAIDDFGMGHSALSRLQAFPVDRLKIDRSFVAPLGDAVEPRRTIAAAMLAMAESLALGVVAEGVETVAQWEALRALGCEVAQGFLFARPLPPADVEGLFGRSVFDAGIGQTADGWAQV